MTRPLEHTIAKRQRKPIITIDLETEGFDGPFIYAAIADERDDSYQFFDSIDELVAFIFHKRNRGVCYWSHNGQFDWRYLWQSILDRKPVRVSPMIQGESKVIGLTIRDTAKHVITMQDSYALVMSSLDSFSKQFAPEYAKGHIDFEHETFDPKNEQHRDYLRRDVQGLLYALIAYNKNVQQAFGTSIGVTAAGTAIRAFRASIPEKQRYWRVPQDADTFIRNAYYGGRVYLRDVNLHRDAVTLDVNAMYAAAMREGVPYGRTIHVDRRTGKPGIFRIIATCPESIIIPLLAKRDNQSLVWFRGTTETYATTIEIDKALKLGYKITIIEGYEFDGIVQPFTDFLNHCETLESAHRGEAIAAVVKVNRNSLYGKFGSKPEHNKYVISDECPKGYNPVIKEHSNGPVPEFIDGLWSTMQKSDHDYMHPEWAAWITANARLKLYSINEAIGLDNVLYNDTDSVIAPRELIQQAIVSGKLTIGTMYGELKREKEWATFQAAGPKCYSGTTQDGQFQSAAKGIPKRLHTPELFATLGSVTFTSPSSMLTMVRGEPRYGIERTRTMPKLENSASVSIGEHGRVYARKYELAPSP